MSDIQVPNSGRREYIIEYEDDMLNMSKYAERLGMPLSSFSKCIKKLVDIGLIEKYKTNQNKKEIIVRASKKGREVYTLHSKNLNHNIFNKMFEILSPLNDQDMKLVADAIKALNDSLYSTVKVESSDTLIRLNKTKASCQQVVHSPVSSQTQRH